MDDREGAVAFIISLNDDPNRSNVVNLLVFFLLLLHLLIDAVQMLRTSIDIDPMNTQLIQTRFETGSHIRKLGFQIGPTLSHPRFNRIIILRL